GFEVHPRPAPVGERAPGEQCHHQQPEIVLLAVVIHGDDVRMVELGEDLRLAPEAGNRLVIARVTDELLDRNLAHEPDVPAAPPDPERPPADLAGDVVVGQGSSDGVPVGVHSSSTRVRRSGGANATRRTAGRNISPAGERGRVGAWWGPTGVRVAA